MRRPWADSVLNFFRLQFIPATSLLLLLASPIAAETTPISLSQNYDYQDTRNLVSIVNDAAALVQSKGEAAFADFSVDGSRWRQGERYIFVIDPSGTMLVHPDPALEGKEEMELKDIDGRPIIRGLIHAATVDPAKPEGWYHYQWPVPGQILPRWKSSYVRLVTAPSGKRYIVGSGIYNDRMEKSFVVDLVDNAAAEIKTNPQVAYAHFRDPIGPYRVKDAYIFVIDPTGVDLVNPAFPNLEGQNLLKQKDSEGKSMIQEMLNVARTSGSGWVDYMWPKPGESVPTQKSAYLRKVETSDGWLVVGCGVYLANAPRISSAARVMTASQLMELVRKGAAVLEKQGEAAFPEFRRKGSKWFGDHTYFLVTSMDGTRVLHAADPSLEGKSIANMKDILGRPYGQMFLDTASGPSGEGWVHYMYPKPGDIFPAWKSTFVKRVTFPSGQQYLIGCGVYDMQMNRTFIEDVVIQAAELIASQGEAAFPVIRNKNGPFVFMDTYVFVLTPDGTQVVNAAFPSLEGKNILDLKDRAGNPVIREEIKAAQKHGNAWLSVDWYKPGQNAPAPEETYVVEVRSGSQTFIVGSGYYPQD